MGFWYRFSATINLFGMQLIRFVFEVFRLIFFVMFLIPMLINDKAYQELHGLFWKELSDYEKDDKNEEDGK